MLAIRCRIWTLLICMILTTACGSIPNDPDDTSVSDLVGAWVLRDQDGNVLERIEFFDEFSPPPLTSPYGEGRPSEGPPLNYLWRFEAQGPNPLETLYGTYNLTRTDLLALTVEWAGNVNNTLVRRIPASRASLEIVLTGQQLELNGTTYLRASG